MPSRARLAVPAVLAALAAGCGRTPPPRAPVARPPAPAAAAPPAPPEGALPLPPPEVRVALFDGVRAAIERLDGDGLVFRETRPEPWAVTTARLREEARRAASLHDLGRVFRRLDATYPNLHTRVFLRPELDERATAGAVRLPFAFRARHVARGEVAPPYVLTDVAGARFDPEPARDGDELVAINGLPMDHWARENLVFCEFPLREQCALELADALRRELLGWSRHDPLSLTLRRGARTFEVRPRVRLAPARPSPAPEKPACGVTAARYPGFALAYGGRHACVFESPRHPGVAVLRIRSFAYRTPGAVASLSQETRALWDRYWSRRAPRVTRLVIDVIDNGGGDAPVEYYRLLLPAPFQEQYAQYRSFAELASPPVLADALWNDPSHLAWQAALARDGRWRATAPGGYLPAVPQFCADDDCRGPFAPRDHGFRGEVQALVSPWCVSSCAGFVWELRDVLGPRFRAYGMPDSGDTTFARLVVAARPDPSAPGGVRVEVAPRATARAPFGREWVRQVVSVTRTTDAAGRVLSGAPQPVAWVPRAAGQGTDRWAATVLRAALGDRPAGGAR